MKRILIGYMRDGKGGLDKYIKGFVSKLVDRNTELEVDVLTSYNYETVESMFEQYDNVCVCKIHSLKEPFKQYNDIIRLTKKNKYDVVYFNISEATNCVGVFAAYKCKIPKIIVHSHSAGIDVENGIRRGVRRVCHEICKRNVVSKYATEFVSCSDKAAEWMFSNKIVKEKKYITVFNEIDFDKFRFNQAVRDKYRKELCIDNKLVIGAVGGFSYQKNNLFFVDIVKELIKINEDICFLAIGEGVLLDKVQKYAKEKGVSEKVLFLGQRSDVAELMMAMDVFVMPSRFEGFGYSALEAQSTGLYCLLSDNIPTFTKLSDRCQFIGDFDPLIWADKITRIGEYSRECVLFEEDIKEYIEANDKFIKMI